MSKVTIRADRMLVLDGQPFFALQARHMPVGATMQEVSEAGFNCFRHSVFGSLSWGPQDLPEERHGLKICAYLFDRTNLRADDKHDEELTSAIEELRPCPDLLAYETYNEPAWRPDAPTVVNQRAEDLATGYQLIRELDPDHPVHQGHSASATIEALQEYNVAADIVGCNPYPVSPKHMRMHIGTRPDGRALDSPDQGLSAVVDYTEKMVQVGDHKMPVWMQLQAMAWEDFHHISSDAGDGESAKDLSAILYPTYEQMRYMAFADITHGASGLLFSMYCVPTDKPVWQDIRRLALELRGLDDVLAGETVDLALDSRYRNLGYSIWKGVRVLGKRCDGGLFMLATNNAFDPAEVTWSGLDRLGIEVLEVLGEGRRVQTRRGAATDYFEAYGVHVYMMR